MLPWRAKKITLLGVHWYVQPVTAPVITNTLHGQCITFALIALMQQNFTVRNIQIDTLRIVMNQSLFLVPLHAIHALGALMVSITLDAAGGFRQGCAGIAAHVLQASSPRVAQGCRMEPAIPA